MPEVELIMPKMGESIMEATILNWLKSEGDTIELEEAVLEIATDKVDSEVPSSVAGVLVKQLYKEGDVVPVGHAVALIQTEVGVGSPAQKPVSAPVNPEPVTSTPVQASAVVAPESVSTVQKTIEISGNGNGQDRFYSPLVINIARREGVSMAELEKVPGSGSNNRVTKKDILSYLENRGSGEIQSIPSDQTAATEQQNIVEKSTPAPKAPVAGSVVHGGNVEIIELDRMRQLIAKHMTHSMQTSAHVTSFVETDITNMVLWRNKVKRKYEEKYGEKLTYTPLLMEALIKTIAEFPQINASVDGNKLIIKKDINIGMAAALPSGNLIVPVIKNANHLNLLGLTKKVNDLANRARTNKLKPDEVEGGTYTISNVGTFGNVMGTPIINQPQVAIMAVGAIRKKPVVIETEEGDTIGIRQMMFLSHSYDHRVVDGFLGGSFVRKMADFIEAFDINREI